MLYKLFDIIITQSLNVMFSIWRGFLSILFPSFSRKLKILLAENMFFTRLRCQRPNFYLVAWILGVKITMIFKISSKYLILSWCGYTRLISIFANKLKKFSHSFCLRICIVYIIFWINWPSLEQCWHKTKPFI